MTPRNRWATGGGAILIASASLVSFISGWEGNAKLVYADKLAGGLPTVCSGHTGPDVKMGDMWTKEQCDAILVKDVTAHGKRLFACITVPINQNEYDAYAAWAFNVGTGAACGSTLVKLLNAGHHTAACDQLLRWDRAGGRVVRGLRNRRVAERVKCLTPVTQDQKALA